LIAECASTWRRIGDEKIRGRSDDRENQMSRNVATVSADDDRDGALL
jgi:hypothetical protein